MRDGGNEIILDLVAADNLIRHIIQRRSQITDFVAVIAFDAGSEFALRHLRGDSGDILQRLDNRIRQTEAEQNDNRHNR
ncbi:hypothetical protein D3C86_1956370 [compost metagenome]